MRRILPIVAAWSVLTACETEPTTLRGVQIGSEGLIGQCTTQQSGSTETVAGFSSSNEMLAERLLGNWTLGLPTGGAGGTASISTTDFRSLVEEEGCGAGVMIGVSVVLAADPFASSTLSGNVLVAPDESGRMLVNAATFELEQGLSEGMQARETVDLVWDGPVVESALGGDLFLLGCDGTGCIEENLSDVSGTR